MKGWWIPLGLTWLTHWVIFHPENNSPRISQEICTSDSFCPDSDSEKTWIFCLVGRPGNHGNPTWPRFAKTVGNPKKRSVYRWRYPQKIVIFWWEQQEWSIGIGCVLPKKKHIRKWSSLWATDLCHISHPRSMEFAAFDAHISGILKLLNLFAWTFQYLRVANQFFHKSVENSQMILKKGTEPCWCMFPTQQESHQAINYHRIGFDGFLEKKLRIHWVKNNSSQRFLCEIQLVSLLWG